MNEQNSGKNFQNFRNFRNYWNWRLGMTNRSRMSKPSAETLREISEIIQIEDYASRIDHEWAKLRQKFWGKFQELFKLKIMHQESIKNEQNLGKNFRNFRNYSNWRLCMTNRSRMSKDQAKILREILEIIQIEDYAPRIDNEWLKLRQKIWGKFWKVF